MFQNLANNRFSGNCE